MNQKESPKIHYFESLDSTNLKLKKLAKDGTLPELSVVVAKDQTAGRGQPGNYWESEAGKNLTFSVYIQPDFLIVQQQFCITQMVTLALMDVLKPLYSNVSIKWPNDIYADDYKLAGILIENNLKGNTISDTIIGIGLNLNQTIFKSNAPNPISLCQLTGKEHSIEEILKPFLSAFVSRYINWMEAHNNEEMKEAYLQNLYRSSGWHWYSDKTGRFEACFSDIKEDGHLQLRTRTEEIRTYAFKEVSFIL
jgi:BirA family transcriptional regulator, biotin operon repressor / biotin---[acetyl-CoA-carboxylase] ligase